MSDVPDLGQIRPPDQPPADQPDPKTTDEAQELKKKAPSPLEREADARRAHIASLNERILYHNGECEHLRAEIALVRGSLDGVQQREQNLAVRCKQLETASGITGCFNLLGIVLTIGGPCLLGYAGSALGLSDAQKNWYCAGGGGITICGILVLLISYSAALWHKPR